MRRISQQRDWPPWVYVAWFLGSLLLLHLSMAPSSISKMTTGLLGDSNRQNGINMSKSNINTFGMADPVWFSSKIQATWVGRELSGLRQRTPPSADHREAWLALGMGQVSVSRFHGSDVSHPCQHYMESEGFLLPSLKKKKKNWGATGGLIEEEKKIHTFTPVKKETCPFLSFPLRDSYSVGAGH